MEVRGAALSSRRALHPCCCRRRCLPWPEERRSRSRAWATSDTILRCPNALLAAGLDSWQFRAGKGLPTKQTRRPQLGKCWPCRTTRDRGGKTIICLWGCVGIGRRRGAPTAFASIHAGPIRCSAPAEPRRGPNGGFLARCAKAQTPKALGGAHSIFTLKKNQKPSPSCCCGAGIKLRPSWNKEMPLLWAYVATELGFVALSDDDRLGPAADGQKPKAGEERRRFFFRFRFQF